MLCRFKRIHKKNVRLFGRIFNEVSTIRARFFGGREAAYLFDFNCQINFIHPNTDNRIMDDKLKVLAIDDDFTQLELLKTFSDKITFPGIELITAETAKEGLDRLAEDSVDLVLTDYRLPDRDGLEVLREIKSRNPLINVVVMTAFESAREAVEILKSGGDDYLIKPVKLDDIEHIFLRIFEQQSLIHENIRVDREIEASFPDLPLVYNSRPMQNVLNVVARSSETDATVLITGESGTGKELIARLIHKTSLRKDKPFISVNIAALPETLMESELFGHVKGAFTGAEKDRPGRFEEADGGTLFIDEVGDIPVKIQVKLLRIIQFGKLQKVGENLEKDLNIRIIAATSRNLEHMISEGTFREDLFWRLNVIKIELPALRHRKSEIPLLAEHFIEMYNKKNRKSVEGISREGLDKLMAHRFPGNIRELENIIERAVILSRGRLVTAADLPEFEDQLPDNDGTGGELIPKDYNSQLRAFEISLIQAGLEQAAGNQSEAARLLNISERRLRSRLDILGLKGSS